MSITGPQFDAHNYLGPGVHRCNFQELESLLGWNESRRHLFRQLQQFIDERLLPEFGMQPPLVLDGHFVTRHDHPREIVAVVLMDQLEEESFWHAAELCQHYEALRCAIGCGWCAFPIACMSRASARWGTSASMPALMAGNACSITGLP